MPIRILDAATVGRIAAGEVVERPSSVVKELIENSLDAGATSITVEVKGGGIDYLRVTDNGCGIEPGQVRLAFENHATSKIQTAEQLNDIRTLGFRGEALPSIAAVSRVEMTTRAKGQSSGMKLTIEGGQNMNVREAGCPQGTTIIMRDLFFNVPVRRAFLKKASYEGGLVSDAVAKLLLGNPGVSMRFISGGNTMFHSFGDGKLRHAVFSVYGREAAEKMVEIDASEGGTRIHGLIGVGELAKATRSHQLFFINGRSVRCPLLSKALEQVCKSRVTIGMYPMCVLNLEIPSTGVDVNVHPNKLEVRFRDEQLMRTACENLLSRAFENERVLEIEKLTQEKPAIERRTEIREIPLPKPIEAPAAKLESSKAETVKPRIPEPKPEQTRIQFSAPQPVLREKPIGIGQPVKTVKLPDCPAVDPVKTVKIPEKSAEAAIKTVKLPERVIPAQSELPKSSPKPEKKETEKPADKPEAPQFRVIGVLFKTYILVETGDTLLLIDQHAAHERLQYERYMARANAGAASQQLLTPIVLNLSAREMAVLMENRETLADAGYDVESFGENDIQIRAVPFVMGKAELKPLFLEMIHSLGQLKAATLDARRSEIIQLACKTAVKAGDSLSNSEISALISAMLETGAPPTCPHGRPVVKAMSKREIEKLFKRIQ